MFEHYSKLFNSLSLKSKSTILKFGCKLLKSNFFTYVYSVFLTYTLTVTAQVFSIKKVCFCDSQKIKFIKISCETNVKKGNETSPFF